MSGIDEGGPKQLLNTASKAFLAAANACQLNADLFSPMLSATLAPGGKWVCNTDTGFKVFRCAGDCEFSISQVFVIAHSPAFFVALFSAFENDLQRQAARGDTQTVRLDLTLFAREALNRDDLSRFATRSIFNWPEPWPGGPQEYMRYRVQDMYESFFL